MNDHQYDEIKLRLRVKLLENIELKDEIAYLKERIYQANNNLDKLKVHADLTSELRLIANNAIKYLDEGE